MTNNEHNEDIRIVAQSMYDHIITMSGRGPQSPMDSTRSHSINLITEEFLRGYMEDGRMSVVRRFFCLFVTFDLIFIALLWLICIMITGDNIYNALKVQVLHYSVYTSLFDIVMAALCRFVVLILFYALLYIDHWIVIAFSTSLSCLFLISKVFLYNWVGSAQPVFQVVLIVTSFVLAWGEAWFLDYRVIPQERHSRSYFVAATQQATDRSPLIVPFLSTDVVPAESTVNFYSPYDSIHNSDDEDEECEEYRKAGVECVRRAYNLLESGGWKIEKVTKKGDTIQSKQKEDLGKIYRLTGQIQYSAKGLLNDLFYNVESFPKWNPTLLESKIIRKIDAHTDISYQASAGGGGGLVKSRDFVNLRCWHVYRNGKIVSDDEENSNDTKSSGSLEITANQTDFHRKSITNIENVKKSMSGGNIECSSQSVTLSTSLGTLSRSLGAKDFHKNFSAEPPPLPDERLNPELIKKPWETSTKIYLSAAVSIPYPGLAKSSKYTRGENLLSCWAMREIEGKTDSCIFEWLLCLDLKGYIPKYILDTAYTTLMEDYMAYLRKHCNELQKERIN